MKEVLRGEEKWGFREAQEQHNAEPRGTLPDLSSRLTSAGAADSPALGMGRGQGANK